jgi:hypothetical protein
MSTAELPVSRISDLSEEIAYRPIHAGAIASLVLGLLSTMVFVAGRDSVQGCLMLCPIPLLGLVVGLRAWRRIKVEPDHWSGAVLARSGSLLSAACLVGGLSFAGYVYSTEVPDGYVRVSFLDLRPDEVEKKGDEAIPADVAALDGKKVFIKGYIRPDSTPYRQNISKFLLVRDNQQCCFGDISSVNFYDQMAVALAAKKTVDYSSGVLRMGGVLRINPRNLNRGKPVFSLEADYAK